MLRWLACAAAPVVDSGVFVDHFGSNTPIQCGLDVFNRCTGDDGRELLVCVRGIGREPRELQHGVRNGELGQCFDDLVLHPDQHLLLLGCVQRPGEARRVETAAVRSRPLERDWLLRSRAAGSG